MNSIAGTNNTCHCKVQGLARLPLLTSLDRLAVSLESVHEQLNGLVPQSGKIPSDKIFAAANYNNNIDEYAPENLWCLLCSPFVPSLVFHMPATSFFAGQAGTRESVNEFENSGRACGG